MCAFSYIKLFGCVLGLALAPSSNKQGYGKSRAKEFLIGSGEETGSSAGPVGFVLGVRIHESRDLVTKFGDISQFDPKCLV